uniref:tryptophan synthase n=1 Tax=Eucampia antarctica TaxID=49252 RepID=A0A7S2R108_9STRA|mmetsp:Transcript_12677/g.12281  ORF Transcript_12677/g.12281 Transcript_12677/m.12281 type:complete len:470 (+) Transcript_12677:293-1702(+)
MSQEELRQGGLQQHTEHDMSHATGATSTPQPHLNNSNALGTLLPHPDGYFGADKFYGGAYLPPPLVPIMEAVGAAYLEIKEDPTFLEELTKLRRDFCGRPSPIFHCKNLSAEMGGGAQIYLKREDLNHTGSHKINHCLGEVLLAKKMNKTKVIAETGAGQHGVALATCAALMGLECEIHMGEVDVKKQWANVRRMQVLGATVVVATHGMKTLKEAVDSAFGAYIANPEDMLFCIGSVVGPHPFPMMVRDFQAIVGYEAKKQFAELHSASSSSGRTNPDYLVACVGGGCNSLGLFTAFLEDEDVKLVGVEPAGRGLSKGEGHHSATLTLGKPGVIHGMKCYTLLNEETGEPAAVHSCASGLDYPGVGPQHSFFKDLGRVTYETATDKEVIDAFFKLSRSEGIIPALESAHGLAYAMKLASTLPNDSDATILVNMSGRGDKDLDYVCDMHGDEYGIGKEGVFAGPTTTQHE